MKILVQFRSFINVVWGTNIQNREAFAYMRGFPATFFLTERRAIVVGEFLEKEGWFRKKKNHKVIFEAGLHYLKDFKINIIPEKKIFTGYISFHPHNQMGEGAIIQFLKMRPEIGDVINNHLSQLNIKHPIEDTGIVLGKAIKDALGDKKGISRFADATIPLDEALTRIVIDISGRAYLYFNVKFNRTDDGSNVNPYLFEEFFRGLVNSAEITMHIDTIRGNNSHHIIESIFKAFAKAFEGAIKITGKKLPTTKGVL